MSLLSSMIEAAVAETSPNLGVGPTRLTLEDGTLPLRDIEQVETTVEDATWEIAATWDDGTVQVKLQIYMTAVDNRMVQLHLDLGQLDEPDAKAMLSCSHCIGVSADLDNAAPLDSFHAQLRVLHHLAPDAVGVVDGAACVARPTGWLEEAATSSVAPHPTHLWSIHAVHDDRWSWLHTHGLHRCGRIELDMLDIPMGSQGLMGQLLNAAAGMMLDDGVPEPDEPFLVGQGIELVWLPVDDALAKVGKVEQGGRDERDPIHTVDRGVLLVKKKGMLWGHSYKSPLVYLPILEDHPLLYVSNMETNRRVALAHERFDRYQALFSQVGESPAFQFLIKIGYPTDDDSSREHIWFDFHGMQDGRIDGTCLNRPHAVAGLREGLRGLHEPDLMSDWALLCPLGQLGPDQTALVERAVSDPSFMAQVDALMAGD